MKKILLVHILQVICLVLVKAQPISVGFTSLEDYARRSQLQGNFDSTYSFSLRPIRPGEEDSLMGYNLSTEILAYADGLVKFSLLPIESRSEYNSHHPKESNNGGMVPGKGFQSILSIGAYFELGPLKAYIKPDLHYSQNKSYDGFPDTIANHIWDIRYRWWNKTDLPEQFGPKQKSRILHGQSKISLDYESFSLGISTENLWWGPGKYNSLLMTNHSRGFLHLSFNSKAPLTTPIGNFEWQLIGGRLEGSGYSPPIPDRYSSNYLFVPKNEDWRYLSAISLIYSPKWIPGLSIGFNRAYQQYSETAKSNSDYLPIFLNFFRENDRINRQELEVDQVLSAFFRYYSSKSHAEFYFEYGRNDASLNFRDFIMSPEHSRAFVVGGSKLFRVNSQSNIELNLELTQLQQSISNLVRPTESWYTHTRVSHGYTNKGEVLGAAIGPGSNSQIIELNWTRGIKKIGIQFERVVHNNDFFLAAYDGSNDWRRYWVDLSPGANFSWDFNNLLVQSRVYITRSLNYQWELHNNPGNRPYFVEGRDVTNLFLSVNVAYFLDDLNFRR